MYLLPQLEDHQPNVVFEQDGAPPNWDRIFREFFVMGAGLCVMEQFHGLRAQPILRCLIYSCGNRLRTLFTSLL
jgi:hypothetical protein